jgi:peptidoglycan hydrolase-like protein with peptidoglycan-binding domain
MPVPRWGRAALAGAGVALFAGAVGWSIARVSLPPVEVVDEPDYLTVEATVDEVRSELSLSVSARWPEVRALTSLVAGTVTSLGLADGALASPGSVLYSVDLAPVVVLPGTVPAFRTMASGTEGPDVAQLQAFLSSRGGDLGAVDGRFGDDTERSVREWQEAVGAVPDGVIDLGEVVFLDDLPRVVTRDEHLAVGRVLAPGDRVGSVVAAAPVFDLTVNAHQSAAIPAGAVVDIAGPGPWTAVVGDRTTTQDGDVVLSLEGADGATVCANGCAAVSLNGRTSFDAVVQSRPPVRGVVVPTAAIRTGPDGATMVIEASGRAHPVTVEATASGWSVVHGLVAGVAVRVPVDSAES